MLFPDSAQSSAAAIIHVSTNMNHIDFLYEGSRMIFGPLYTCYILGTGASDGPLTTPKAPLTGVTAPPTRTRKLGHVFHTGSRTTNGRQQVLREAKPPPSLT